jgi:uncharacterized membrane-anchored protein
MTQNLAQKFRQTADKTHQIDGEYLRAETNEILFELETAAGRGLYQHETNKRYHSVILERLKVYGFKITLHADQRDGICDVISWK